MDDASDTLCDMRSEAKVNLFEYHGKAATYIEPHAGCVDHFKPVGPALAR
jgi:hypothetical protein